jgi:hypothetical protein
LAAFKVGSVVFHGGHLRRAAALDG